MNAKSDGPDYLGSASTEAGHDAPVLDRTGDHYDRWPIATAISRVIQESPRTWSTRIGLFGSWGDGKTTVLNFLQEQQRSAGNIVIRFSPWGVSTEKEVWKEFGNALTEGLRECGIGTGAWRSTVVFLRRNWSWLSSGSEGVAKAAQASGYAPGAEAGAKLANSWIAGQLQLNRKKIESIVNQLGSRRVVVFIDDLDRADPSLVPKLLLALRELLDVAQFAFVLAFDRKIVAKSLETYNPAWGHAGADFLDKVIDFSFDLPSPTQEQIQKLAMVQFRSLCAFVPPPAFEEVLPLLPSNPRKIKLFARMIASTKDEAIRHNEDELDWVLVVLFSLLKLESEDFASEIRDLAVGYQEFDWLTWATGRNSEEARAKQSEAINALIDKFPRIAGERVRVVDLVKAFLKRCSVLAEGKLKYQTKFALSPDCITWGEFNRFFEDWRVDKAVSKVKSFVQTRASRMRCDSDRVEDELLDTLVQFCAEVLEEASHVSGASRHSELLIRANDNLDLICQCLVGENRACELPQLRLLKVWKLLLEVFGPWQHFTANKGEPELRGRECQVLINLAAEINDGLALFDIVRPWDREERVLGARFGKEGVFLLDRIREEIEPRAIPEALQIVEHPGRLKKLRLQDEALAAKFLLTSPRSPCFQQPILGQLLELVRRRKGSTDARDDALVWLDFFLKAFAHGDRFCPIDARKAFLSERSDLITILWDLATEVPTQYRFLSELMERRDQLVKGGVSNAALPLPEWLLVATKDAQQAEQGAF
ncbi:MAG: hypothetical protein JNM79_03975 [Burkholderiales bacterium]|nr:hypothetical protein [Burkholderiales bacterium]